MRRLPQAELFRQFDKVDDTLAFIRQYEPRGGYWLAFSGGKDSVVLYDLAVRARVKFTAHYNVTTVDPPELLRFMLKHYPDVIWHRPAKSMYQLIQTNGLPTRIARWCCRLLKEAEPKRGWVLTGIRAEESPGRKHRPLVERCFKNPLKTFVHPIKNWTEGEIWDYIAIRKLPYCVLYAQGRKRIGCVLCPFSRDVAEDLRRYPKIAGAYKAGLKIYCEKHGRDTEEVWKWWLSRDYPLISQDECPLLFA